MKNNEAGKEDWEYWTKMKSLILKRRPNQAPLSKKGRVMWLSEKLLTRIAQDY